MTCVPGVLSPLLTFWVASVAAAGHVPETESQLRSVLASLPHSEAVAGACVIDVATGQAVFAENADRPLIPASNMKVFVMGAAIMELGPGFAFETVLATDGSDVVIIGDGDPALGDEKLCQARGETAATVLERWGDALREYGMTVIPGDLVIDESVFDEQRTHPSWEPEDLGKWYAAPVGGLNLNDNCIDITVSPAGKTGAPVLVAAHPENSLVKIINRCRTGDGDPILHHSHLYPGVVAPGWPWHTSPLPVCERPDSFHL